MYLWRARKIAWLVVGFVFSGVTVSDLAADVSVTGSLSSKSIIEGELLRFTLNVNNKTGTSLKNFRLLGPPDSYQFQQIYADSGQDSPHYYANARDFSQAKNVLFPAVPPGASYTAWGYLQSTKSQGRHLEHGDQVEARRLHLLAILACRQPGRERSEELSASRLGALFGLHENLCHSSGAGLASIFAELEAEAPR